MNAASWLASPAVQAVETTLRYADRFNPQTGLSEYAPAYVSVSASRSALPPAAIDRLSSLMQPATAGEIVYHLNRLLLHRRKSGIGEATIPAFVEDVAGDMIRLGVSSLGVAITAAALRRHPLDRWFPQWPEIEAVSVSVEAAIRAMVSHAPVEKQQELAEPARDRRDIPRKQWNQQDWQDFCDEAARMAAMWRDNGETKKATEWVEICRGRVMECDAEPREFIIRTPDAATWVLDAETPETGSET